MINSKDWIDINESQPEENKKVLFLCLDNVVREGEYLGEFFCTHIHKFHPMSNRPEAFYGEFGRYVDLAAKGYKAISWKEI